MTVLYTEFACRSGGSNLNAGTLDGSTTVVAAAAKVTYTGGDWNATTRVFTVNGGQSMTEAQVGRYMSVYPDGNTAPASGATTIGKISSVVGSVITLDATVIYLFGTGTTTGSGNRSAKIGGAWVGPSGSVTWPVNNAITPLRLGDTQRVRVNFCNDQTYSITPGNLGLNASAAPHWRGYNAAYGDGGKAVWDGGTSGSSAVLMSTNSGAPDTEWCDFEFKNNGNSGSAKLITNASNSVIYRRCVFRDCRGEGFSNTLGCVLEECEFYGCNQSNSGTAACLTTNSEAVFLRCIAHDNTGNATNGFRSTFGGTFIECIADTNGSNGFQISGVGRHHMSRCDTYNNAASGLDSTVGFLVDSCNFVKNGTYGINLNVTSSERMMIAVNCGFGAGTQANGTADTHNAVIEEGSTSYASNTTPWNDPANGDFTVTNTGAKTGARSTFTETAASYSGTTSSATRGAAQCASSAVADYPAVTNVRSGTTYNSGTQTGTMTLPAVTVVLTGSTYGAGGTEFTGTRTDAAVNKVLSGYTYGAGGTGLTGTRTAPAVTDVRSGTTFGDPGAVSTGTLTLPGVATVLSTTSYGAGGSEFTGTYVSAAVAKVLSGYTYGAGGSGLTGTRTDASADDVRSGTTYGDPGAVTTGNMVEPSQADVKSGVQYGTSGTQYTGTYVAGSSGGCSLVGPGGLVL